MLCRTILACLIVTLPGCASTGTGPAGDWTLEDERSEPAGPDEAILPACSTGTVEWCVRRGYRERCSCISKDIFKERMRSSFPRNDLLPSRHQGGVARPLDQP